MRIFCGKWLTRPAVIVCGVFCLLILAAAFMKSQTATGTYVYFRRYHPNDKWRFGVCRSEAVTEKTGSWPDGAVVAVGWRADLGPLSFYRFRKLSPPTNSTPTPSLNGLTKSLVTNRR